MPTEEREWVAIGLVARARGRRGELIALPLAGRPERFEGLRRVWLFRTDVDPACGREYEIESAWLHDGRPVLKLRGVDSIADAEALSGAEIRLPLAERAPLEEGEFYQSDLAGCGVWESGGEYLGTVTGLAEFGGPSLLRVGTPAGGELLIPFARSICVEIDVAAHRIRVELPEGLKELNRE